MSRNPMRTLVELARVHEETSLKRLAGLLADCRTQKDQLALLEHYRLDYQQRLTANGKRGIAPIELDNFRRFMAQLDLAVAKQGGTLARAEDRSAQGKLNWHAALRELRSYEALLERREVAARVLQAGRAQASDDEAAARQSGALRR